ncbi:MlaA family lipoprotein [Azoarcus taiwanensis]|uniref:VacJ family lipoprotein n=1 Tax=Azoarcus taiwanensis TaxID=666964 RepID=A0A972F9S3_9RHOO|nr:VacJ family lipoprotein [Azoarcus taiwanensis]NMG04976.1 VacJ family lipoprotein [Azoarcus taiwanensis]
MRAFRTLMFAAMVLATTACASNAIKDQAASPAVEMPPATATVAASQPNVPPATGTTVEAGDAAAAQMPNQAELDAEDFHAQKLVPDPWEGFNRKMHGFNNAADKFVLRPLAVGYKKITPEPVQAGVSRFFANLSMPVTVVNQALQGRPGDATRSLGRFAVNTTVGIVGVFDPASHFGMPGRNDEDFGQTLATWGWRDSRYLVLPLLGPRTVRDALGIVGDQPLSPIAQIQDSGVASGLQALEIVDVRTRLLPIDQFRRDALDDYVFVRDAWIQRRNHQIQQDLQSDRD